MSVDRFHSLPKKTQPSYTTATRFNTAERTSVLGQVTNCPEVNQFKIGKINLREQVYVHHLEIDYGRLEKPAELWNKGKVKEEESLWGEEEGGMEVQMATKRVKGIAVLADPEHHTKQTQKKPATHKIYLDITPTQILPIDPQSSPNRPTSTNKRKVKLHQVHAYQDKTRQERGNSRRLHSRIVKMMVGGGQTKTKVICYPDNREYLRIWGQEAKEKL